MANRPVVVVNNVSTWRADPATVKDLRINKTMCWTDLQSPEAVEIVDDLNRLIVDLNRRGVQVSSWYGAFDLDTDPNGFERINRGYGYQCLERAADDARFPWFLYWEIAWLAMHSGIRSGQSLLDLGGSSSLFSFYMASKGVDVTTVDLQAELVENANLAARQMGWTLRNHVMDMRALGFDRRFDHVTSVCVYEHIPLYDRVEINRNIAELLVDGGRMSITFDYRNPSRVARIGSPRDVQEQFVAPSGLSVRGNVTFSDNGESYLLHPFYSRRLPFRQRWQAVRKGEFQILDLLRTRQYNDYTFGALFLEKTTCRGRSLAGPGGGQTGQLACE